MDWINTPESSTILQFGYVEQDLILKVEFKNGTVYDYYDVPENVFFQMKNSTSRGQYLAQQIKGTYRYART